MLLLVDYKEIYFEDLLKGLKGTCLRDVGGNDWCGWSIGVYVFIYGSINLL